MSVPNVTPIVTPAVVPTNTPFFQPKIKTINILKMFLIKGIFFYLFIF